MKSNSYLPTTPTYIVQRRKLPCSSPHHSWGPIFRPFTPPHLSAKNDPTNSPCCAVVVFMIKYPHSRYAQILTLLTPPPTHRPLHHLRPTQDNTRRGQQPRPPRTRKVPTSFPASRPHNRDHDPTSTQTHTPNPIRRQRTLPRPHKRTRIQAPARP